MSMLPADQPPFAAQPAESSVTTVQLPAGLVLVQVRGEVTSSSWQWITSVLNRSPQRVLIDLTSVEFFCSPGIAALRGLRRRCADQGIQLWLVAPARARRPLELVGLGGLFTSAENSDDAIAELPAGQTTERGRAAKPTI